MKLFREICKKTFVLISCLCLFFSSSLSVFAADEVLIANPNGFGVAQYFPITPSDYNYSASNLPGGFYSGEFTVNYRIMVRGGVSRTFDGYFTLSNDIQIQFYGSTSINPGYNTITLGVKSAVLRDSAGNQYYGTPNSQSVHQNVNFISGEQFSPALNTVVFVSARDVVIDFFAVLEVTYVVSARTPLVNALVNIPNIAGEYTLSPDVDSSPINEKVGVISDQIDNLTDGFNSGGIDNTNQELSNHLDSYDQAEGAAVDSVTDYFGQVQQPISFFNAGSFLTSTSFVWTYLQGVYDHLGDAKIVVDVVLALTVAFSFIGLGKYIWRVADREDDS